MLAEINVIGRCCRARNRIKCRLRNDTQSRESGAGRWKPALGFLPNELRCCLFCGPFTLVLVEGSRRQVRLFGQLSPDSHWMAYTSYESGQREVKSPSLGASSHAGAAPRCLLVVFRGQFEHLADQRR